MKFYSGKTNQIKFRSIKLNFTLVSRFDRPSTGWTGLISSFFKERFIFMVFFFLVECFIGWYLDLFFLWEFFHPRRVGKRMWIEVCVFALEILLLYRPKLWWVSTLGEPFCKLGLDHYRLWVRAVAPTQQQIVSYWFFLLLLFFLMGFGFSIKSWGWEILTLRRSFNKGNFPLGDASMASFNEKALYGPCVVVFHCWLWSEFGNVDDGLIGKYLSSTPNKSAITTIFFYVQTWMVKGLYLHRAGLSLSH